MQPTLLPPDLQTLVEKRLATGAYRDAEGVLRHALEAQDNECGAVSEQIEVGCEQALRGDLIHGDQAWREIEVRKQEWLAGGDKTPRLELKLIPSRQP